jgi:hypothetical protein
MYLIEHIFDCMLSQVTMDLAQFDDIWLSLEKFRPAFAAMVIHGDLQFEELDMFSLYLSNITLYTLKFMNQFCFQLRCHVIQSKGQDYFDPLVLILQTAVQGSSLCNPKSVHIIQDRLDVFA